MGFGTISNTFINCNGRSVSFHSNSLSSLGCYSGFGCFTPGCFGFGFNNMCGNPYAFGAGVGFGLMTGAALSPLLPGVFKGIGEGCSWLWNNALSPAFKGIGKGCTWLWNNALSPAFKGVGKGCSWLWNNALVPAGKGIWDGIKWVGNGIANGAKWLWNGVKTLWNKIF